MSIVHAIQTLPSAILSHWGYWIVFSASVSEALPVVWLFVPGHSITVLWGFFAKAWILDFWNVCVVAFVWAVLGDFLGYWLGREFWHDLILRHGKRLFFDESRFEKTKKLIRNHTGKAIVGGRFNPLMRALVPFVSWASGIRFLTFSFYNVLGGLAWAFSSVFLGYAFGQSYEIAAKYVGRFLVLAVVASVALVFLYRYVNSKTHVFRWRRPYLLILNIASLYLFSKMVEDVVDGESVTRLDVWIHGHVASLWNPVLNHVVTFLTDIGNPKVLAILSIALLAFFTVRKRWNDAALLCLGMAGWWGLQFLVKVFMERPRPGEALLAVHYGFPSAHATMAAIFFSLLIHYFSGNFKNSGTRSSFSIANVLAFLLIGFGRVYQNTHYLSDVLAGFGLGLFYLTSLMLIFRFFPSFVRRWEKRKARR